MTVAKAIVATLIIIGGSIVTALDGDNTINAADLITIALGALGSAGVVWYVTKAQAAKAFVAAAGAALTSLSVAITNSPDVVGAQVTAQEWITSAVAALVAWSGVYWVSNDEEVTPVSGNAPSDL